MLAAPPPLVPDARLGRLYTDLFMGHARSPRSGFIRLKISTLSDAQKLASSLHHPSDSALPEERVGELESQTRAQPASRSRTLELARNKRLTVQAAPR